VQPGNRLGLRLEGGQGGAGPHGEVLGQGLVFGIVRFDATQGLLHLFGGQVVVVLQQLAGGVEECGRGPAALAVAAVHIRALVGIDADRDKVAVDRGHYVGIGEGGLDHELAGLAPGGGDVEQDRQVEGIGQIERLLVPLVPGDGQVWPGQLQVGLKDAAVLGFEDGIVLPLLLDQHLKEGAGGLVGRRLGHPRIVLFGILFPEHGQAPCLGDLVQCSHCRLLSSEQEGSWLALQRACAQKPIGDQAHTRSPNSPPLTAWFAGAPHEAKAPAGKGAG